MLASGKTLISFLFLLHLSVSVAQENTLQSVPVTGALYKPEKPGFEIIKELPYALPETGELRADKAENLLFTAWVRKGKLNGVWQSFYPGGNSCDSGNLINNLPDGRWVFKDNQGELIAIRHYSSEKFRRVTQEMRQYHPKRSFYHLSALYQRNRRQALACLDAASSFEQVPAVPAPVTLSELAEMNTGGKHGYRPVFAQQLQHGLYMNFFPGAVVRDSGYYLNGLKAGKWIHRPHPDSGWLQGAYQHDYRVKEWKQYNVQGRLEEILHYDNQGNLIWRKKIKRG